MLPQLNLLPHVLEAYILFMHGTLLLLQLIVIYHSFLLISIIFDRFSLNYFAYFAEIFQGGLHNIPIGQYKTAKILGLNRFLAYHYLIPPKLIKKVLASVITLLKDTSWSISLG